MRRAPVVWARLSGVPPGNATQEEAGVNDIPFVLKDEDSAPVTVETIQPRRVRSQLAQLDALVLGFQDDAEALFAHVSSQSGRKTLRGLLSGIQEAHTRVQRIVDAIERGG